MGGIIEFIVANQTLVLVILAVVAVIAIIAILYMFQRGSKKAKAQAAAPAEQKADAKAAPPPRLRPRDMRRLFRRGLAAYRDRVAASHNLNLVPWFLAIGPEGSGKTTLFSSIEPARATGADPLSEREAGCRWRFFDNAVVLDIQGSLIMPKDGSRAGEGMLRTLLSELRRKRWPKGADGIILTIPATELLDPQGLRSPRRPPWRAPCRTSCGRRSACSASACRSMSSSPNATWSRPSRPSRPRCRRRCATPSWAGPTPIRSTPPIAANGWTRRFPACRPTSSPRWSRSSRTTRSATGREEVFAFPSQLAPLRAPVRQQLDIILRQTGYQESLFLRGIYFTGTTLPDSAETWSPLRAPVTLTMAPMLPPPTTAFGIAPEDPVPVRPTTGEAKPALTFGRDLLTKKIFAERDLSRHGTRWSFQRDRVDLFWQGMTVVAAVAAAVVLWIGYKRTDVIVDSAQPVLERTAALIRRADTATTPAQQNAVIEELIRNYNRLEEEWTLPWFASAYMGGLPERISVALSIGHHRVLMQVMRDRLVERARALAQFSGVDADFLRIREMLGKSVLVERYSTVYNGIVGTAEMNGMPELVRYTTDLELPPEYVARGASLAFVLAPDPRLLQGASIDQALRAINMADYRVNEPSGVGGVVPGRKLQLSKEQSRWRRAPPPLASPATRARPPTTSRKRQPTNSSGSPRRPPTSSRTWPVKPRTSPIAWPSRAARPPSACRRWPVTQGRRRQVRQGPAHGDAGRGGRARLRPRGPVEVLKRPRA